LPPPRPTTASSLQPCRSGGLLGQGVRRSQGPSVPWPHPRSSPPLPLFGNLGGHSEEGQQKAQVQVECAHAQRRSHHHLRARGGHEVKKRLAGAP